MTSVIIPTHNAGQTLAGLLKAVRQQTVPCEIIVVDSFSTDDTAGIASSFGAAVKNVGQGGFGHGSSRNLGWRAAAGDVIVYLTQDALPADDQAIARLTVYLDDRNVGAVFGRQLPRPGAGPFGAHARLFNYPGKSRIVTLADRERMGIRTPFFSNSFSAYRRSVLEEIGGFDEQVIMGEDVCAAGRLLLKGYGIAYAADAAVCHSHDYTVFGEFSRYFDIGVFHATESWLAESFGRPEGEGMRYLRSEARFLAHNGRPLLLPALLLRNAMKYAGYLLGKNHRMLPRRLARSMSMHRGWWRGEKDAR
ncbi:MAG: glycosyltransferase family 2 protein [Nitrospiraceae bacterium]|nr:glycosyltransferase family 2 protein [Nitrospiraceae bacterium]